MLYFFFSRNAGFDFKGHDIKEIGSGIGEKGEHILVHFIGCLTKRYVSFVLFWAMQVLT